MGCRFGHVMNANGFTIKRGTNISHLFVDESLPWNDQRLYFNRRDIQCICDFGFDHVRIPIVEERIWHSDGSVNVERIDYLDLVIRQCIDAGLRVILCLQEIASHQFTSRGAAVPALFQDQSEVDKLCSLWAGLSNRFKVLPNEKLAYELLNEPLAPEDEDWNRVFTQVYNGVRGLEPERTILAGSNFFQIPEKIKRLVLPAEDRNIIRSFHFYYPQLFTHNGASWSSLGEYKGPVQYPGRPVPKEHLLELESLGPHPKRSNSPMNKALMRRVIQDAVGSESQSVHPLHCGEFGCFASVPLRLKKRWIADVVGCLDEAGIAWTQWDWKGNFGLLDKTTWRPSGIHPAMGLTSARYRLPSFPKPRLRIRIRRRIGILARFLGYHRVKRLFS